MPRKRSEEPCPHSIAGRLEHLIATVFSPGQGPLDAQQIAALTVEAGHPLTSSYISQLRRGSRTNPTIDSLRVLATVFGVPVSYFFPTGGQSSDESMVPMTAAQAEGAASAERSRESAQSGPRVNLSIATKLQELFDRPKNIDGSPYTVEQVSHRCEELGYEVSALYLQDLLDGVRDNPSIKALEGIARTYDEPVSFFFSAGRESGSGQDQAHADYVLREALKDEGMREITRRSSQLDPAGRRLLAAMLREMGEVKITRHDPSPPPGSDPK
jgi:transcriptional regulator with XRE-family HTH domain